MRNITWLMLPILILATTAVTQAQTLRTGKIIDNTTQEPVEGASIQCTDDNCTCRCTSSANGDFRINCKDCRKLTVTSIGYKPYEINLSKETFIVALTPEQLQLQQVVVSASRGNAVKRSEAPVAISIISAKAIQETRATSIDQLLNKVSGVNMVNLGNEQHQMSIRQPMTTKSLFLYLEDGIPIRTTGLFNHNALLEMNMAATRSIEVIKGPSSSLYGSEAIGGVVNFITVAPTSEPAAKLSLQGNNLGYGRLDLTSTATAGKWGVALSGYIASKSNSYLEFTDFHKSIGTARIDYRFSNKTSLNNSITVLKYYSDMPGGIDSTMFANHSFRNQQTFTYRKVNALRYRSTLSENWNDNSKTTVTVMYRSNSIGQNPAYRVRDDYRRQNGAFIGDKTIAHGEINENSFNSFSFIALHRQKLVWKKLTLTGGASFDLSPSAYSANYIRIHKDTAANKYVSYEQRDSILTRYNTALNNYAAFINSEIEPVKNMKLVASLRYDLFNYTFNNHLDLSAFSGAADTSNNFRRLSPKIGITYNFTPRLGVYANYSEGFVPPQVTDMYTGVTVPNLSPSIFTNYELGGWAEIIAGKLSADISLYTLQARNEIISVKLDDGSFVNQNAGETSHRGIEAGLTGNFTKSLTLRFSGAISKHEFVRFTEKGTDYTGNEMNNAPRWVHNTEISFKPPFLPRLRIAAEWQHVGRYFVNPQNTATYGGYNVLNLRTGYTFVGFDCWINVLNATNSYFSYITTKSSFGYSYQLAEPINVNLGISYNLANLLKKK